jgi:hypothetical protein
MREIIRAARPLTAPALLSHLTPTHRERRELSSDWSVFKPPLSRKGVCEVGERGKGE